MTNKLNRSDYLILDTLHGSNMTDQFHSMTIEEIMEETGNVLGVRMTVYRMVTKLVKLPVKREKLIIRLNLLLNPY